MTGISIIIVTSGQNDTELNQIIDSVEKLLIPNYERSIKKVVRAS